MMPEGYLLKNKRSSKPVFLICFYSEPVL